MRPELVWSENIPPPKESQFTNIVWQIAFKPDGTEFILAIGDRVFVYEATEGTLLHPLRGHTDNVYCVTYSKDGKRFASGGADNNVIIWTSKGEGILKYNHNDSVQCLSYNPVTHVLASGAVTDFGLWSPEQKKVEKFKTNSKVNCMSWNIDGQVLAMGCQNGQILLRNKEGGPLQDFNRNAPVWCLEWNPVKADQECYLAVGCWDQTLTFWDTNGVQQGQDRQLDFDPCSISYFANGEYLVLCGSNNKAGLWTKEGVFLGQVCEMDSWIWGAAVRPRANEIAVGCNDGTVAMHKLSFNIVHALHRERYAYRDSMTDVIIQHLVTEQKVRIKCRDLVKKIAIYKDRLAVQLPDRIIVYTVDTEKDEYDMRYKAYKKVLKKAECSSLIVTQESLVLCKEKKIELISFTGETEREWTMDSFIRYIKIIGGPRGHEGLVVGLKNGQVYKIFITNSFPVLLIQQDTPIRCLDLSATKKQLAVVDENSNLFVYDLATQEKIFEDTGATSVAWNYEMEDMLAYSGNNTLSIKTGNFAPTTQKLLGFVVGFKGSKIFSLHYVTMNTIDIPQTASMYRYLEEKNHEMAYKVACLGVTEQDWRALAIDCIQAKKYKIAKNAFIRNKDVRFLDLLAKIEADRKQPGYNDFIMMGEIVAYQGKYQEASMLFEKGGNVKRAVEMFKELKQWDKVADWSKKLGEKEREDALLDRARDTEQSEWRESAQLYITLNEYKKAIQLIGQKGDVNWLVEICRTLSKADNQEALQMCADIFRRQGQHSFAKEAFLKLGDLRSLLNLHIELGKWDEAMRLVKPNPDLAPNFYLSYAEWLASNDRFEEAREAFIKAERPDVALKLMERLTKNTIFENRFSDTAYYFWQLALENLKLIEDCNNPSVQDAEYYGKFEEYRNLSEIYYAYNFVYKHIEEPFNSVVPGTNPQELIFNACRFLLNSVGFSNPLGVSKLNIFYALSKTAKQMEAYKTARQAYEKIQGLKIPSRWQEEVDLESLTIRAKPFSDREDLFPICNRCMTPNPIMNTQVVGDICMSCKHAFVRSFVSFTTLPLIEFEPEEGITHKRALQLLKQEAPFQEPTGPQTSVKFDQVEEENDTFMNKVAEWADMQMTGEDYRPVAVDEDTLISMRYEDVYILDLTKYCPTLPRKYYKNAIPDVEITGCPHCGHFYLVDQYEFAYLEYKACPFCRKKEGEEEAEENS